MQRAEAVPLAAGVNRLVYRRVQVCFVCGIVTDRPCPGHEYGGLISAHQVRSWAARLSLPWRWSR